MSIAEGVAPRSKFDEEREQGYLALEAYMEMMKREHIARCGNAWLKHGTTWCSKTATEWAEDRELDSQSWPGWHQFMFIRDEVIPTLGKTVSYTNYPPRAPYEEQVGASVPDVVVVGFHTSKSNLLPVMQFKWRDVLVTCRNNFHDWKVSIEMPLGLELSDEILDLVTTSNHLLHRVYFEGFPKEYVYRSLDDGDYALTGQFSTMFSAGPIGFHQMWAFFWLLKRWYEGRFGPLTTD